MLTLAGHLRSKAKPGARGWATGETDERGMTSGWTSFSLIDTWSTTQQFIEQRNPLCWLTPVHTEPNLLEF